MAQEIPPLPRIFEDPYFRRPAELGQSNVLGQGRKIGQVGLTKSFELFMHVMEYPYVSWKQYRWPGADNFGTPVLPERDGKFWRDLLAKDLVSRLSPEKNPQIGFDLEMQVFIRKSKREVRLATAQEDEWYRPMLMHNPKWKKHIEKYNKKVAASTGGQETEQAFSSNETDTSGSLPSGARKVIPPLKVLSPFASETLIPSPPDESHYLKFDSPGPENGPIGKTSANESKIRWKKRWEQPNIIGGGSDTDSGGDGGSDDGDDSDDSGDSGDSGDEDEDQDEKDSKDEDSEDDDDDDGGDGKGGAKRKAAQEAEAKDKKAAEEKAAEARAAQERAAEERAQRAADQRAADQRLADQRLVDQRLAKRAAEKSATEEKAAEEKKAAGKRAAEEKATEEKAAEEKAAEEKAAEEKAAGEKKTAERKAAAEKALGLPPWPPVTQPFRDETSPESEEVRPETIDLPPSPPGPRPPKVDTSSEKLPPATLADYPGLTYGVELEAHLAYHEDLLIKELRKTNEAYGPVKNIPKKIWQRDHRSGSNWFVIENGPHIYVEEEKGNNVYGRLRPCLKEPIHIAVRICRSRDKATNKRKLDPYFKVNAWVNKSSQGKVADAYKTWHICPDISVKGFRSSSLPRYLPDRINDANSSLWDCSGIEVVSRIMTTGDERGSEEITAICKVLNGNATDNHGVFNTVFTGLHVHVQRPSDPKDLCNLSYMIVIFEEEIGKFHPPCRQPLSGSEEGYIFHSWRESFINPVAREKVDDVGYVYDMNNTGNFHNADMLPLPEIWAKLTASAKIDIQAFRTYVCEYYKNSIYWFAGETLEFRQHCGTMDPVEINNWVSFCTKFVRLGIYYNDHGGGCPIEDWDDDRISWRWLCTEMGLSQDEIEYWAARVKQWEDYPKDGVMQPGQAEDLKVDYEKRPDNAVISIVERLLVDKEKMEDKDQEDKDQEDEDEEGEEGEENASRRRKVLRISRKHPALVKKHSRDNLTDTEPDAKRHKVSRSKHLSVSKAPPSRYDGPQQIRRISRKPEQYDDIPATAYNVITKLRDLHNKASGIAPNLLTRPELDNLILMSKGYLSALGYHGSDIGHEIDRKEVDAGESGVERWEELVDLVKDIASSALYLGTTKGEDGADTEELAMKLYRGLNRWIRAVDKPEFKLSYGGLGS